MFSWLFPRIQLKMRPHPHVVIRGLNKLPDEAMAHVSDALRGTAQRIVIRMKDKMRGTKSGMVYVWKKAERGQAADFFVRGGHGKWFPVVFRGTPHKASARGEAPAVDTRGTKTKSLYKSIRWRQTSLMRKVTNVEVGVDWNAPYAPHLEYGTKYMRERPMLFPSVREEISSGNFLTSINARLTAAGYRPLR